MGSDLSPIDASALNRFAWKGLVVAVLIAVIGAIGSFGFLLLQWRTSSVREQASDWRISVLEVQAKKADADLERAKADIADADARAAGAQADATRATERAAALEADAAKAQERITTLEKEAAAKATIADADARAAEAQLALERAKADIADADARAAGAHKTSEAKPSPNLATEKTPALGYAIAARLLDVQDVKRVLRHTGNYSGPINNEPDLDYRQAVIDFQNSRQITVDGLVGAETLVKLKEAWPDYFRPRKAE
jgi:peptidoglycan hydrolase-like protein with peptidoglycan-binding domain